MWNTWIVLHCLMGETWLFTHYLQWLTYIDGLNDKHIAKIIVLNTIFFKRKDDARLPIWTIKGKGRKSCPTKGSLLSRIIKYVWYSKMQKMPKFPLLPLFCDNKSNCLRNLYSITLLYGLVHVVMTYSWESSSYYISYSYCQASKIVSQNTI